MVCKSTSSYCLKSSLTMELCTINMHSYMAILEWLVAIGKALTTIFFISHDMKNIAVKTHYMQIDDADTLLRI